MEKQRLGTALFRRARLLILPLSAGRGKTAHSGTRVFAAGARACLALVCLAAFAPAPANAAEPTAEPAAPSAAEPTAPSAAPANADELLARPEKPSYSLAETPSYTLVIRDASPAGVSVETPAIPGLALLSLEETQSFAAGSPVVVIRMTFRALAPGTIAPEPLTVFVSGARRFAAFEPIVVQPGAAKPRITLQFEGGAADGVFHEGKAALFTLRVQDARKIISLDWQLREDSLLRQAAGQGESFRFEWIPLASGSLELPAFTAEVVTETGGRETARLSGVTRTVQARESADAPAETDAPAGAGQAFIRNAFGL